MFLKYPLYIKWFMPTRWYVISSVLVYITSLIQFKKQNIKSFTIKTMIFLAELITGWLDISWGCTETCGWEKFFNLPYTLQNSSLFQPITNFTKQLSIFMIISSRKGNMYFSRLFLLVWEFFTWLVVIMQGCKNYITIQEWPNSALRKISDIDYQELFPDISSPANIWNMYDE